MGEGGKGQDLHPGDPELTLNVTSDISVRTLALIDHLDNFEQILLLELL